MSADFNDILLEGYVRMRSKHVNNWNKRWVILKSASSKGPRRLEKYQNEKASQLTHIQAECKTISFESIASITQAPHDVRKHAISIELKDGTTRYIAFDSDASTREWLETMKDMHKKRDSYTSSIDELFSVYLLPTPNLNIYGECLLQISTDHINVFDVHDSKTLLVSWPVTGLRRYGKDKGLFQLEAGSKCSTGEGIFSFTTQEADRIHTAVHRASNAIVTAYKASKDTSNTVVKERLERSQSESQSVSTLNQHTPVHQSRSFPEPIRPPPLPPRSSPTLPRSPGANSMGNQGIPDMPPPLPPQRHPSTSSNGAATNINNNNDEESDLYEEKYLEPQFKQYLSQRK